MQTFNQIAREVKNFLQYLASLWGILSVFSAFFPLINKFRGVIPLPKAHQEACVLLSTIACLFLVLYAFTLRRKRTGQSAARNSMWIFSLAVMIALFYLFVLPALPNMPLEQTLGLGEMAPVWQLSLTILRSLAELIEPSLYILVFALPTYAFTILAVLEWRKRETGYY